MGSTTCLRLPPPAVTFFSCSINASHRASAENIKGVVLLSKRGTDGLTVVIQATYRNRRERSMKIGYCRQGSSPIWTNAHYVIPFLLPTSKNTDGRLLDTVIVNELVSQTMADADQTTLARHPTS